MYYQYIHPQWSDIFGHNNLKTFEDFWQLKLPTIDQGNYGRGGNSLVSRHVLQMPDGKEETVYIKRQENYTCFSWQHPFSGIPTFEREFINWKRFQQLGIGTYDLVYFAKRKQGKQQQAILISRALPAIDLVEYIRTPAYHVGDHAFAQRCDITRSVAEILRKMHDAHLQHGHLSPKHVFVGGFPHNIKSYLIDMELMRTVLWKRGRVINDLTRFARRCDEYTVIDRMRFFKNYLGVKKLSARDKALWKAIEQRIPKNRFKKA